MRYDLRKNLRSVAVGVCAIWASLLSAASTQWTYVLPSGASGSFSATESTTPATVDGTFLRLSNGFVRLTVTAATGTGAPDVGTVKYALEAPNFALFSESFLSFEGTLIVAGSAGTCPQETWSGLLSYFFWRGTSGTTYDVSNSATPAFGVFGWNPATNIATVSDMRNLTSLATLSGFSSFTNGGSCSNGQITFSGTGDRGGTLNIGPSGGAVYTTQTSRAMFLLPQHTIESASRLNGTYTVLGIDNDWPQNVTALRMTISGGTTASGDALVSIQGDTEDTSQTWTIASISINSPVNGMFSGSLSVEGGSSRNIACLTHFSAATTLFCSAQSPDNAAVPQNLIFVSDSQGYSSGTTDTYSFGSGTGIVSTNAGGTDAIRGVTIQSDNKILAAGNATHFAVARYYPSGNLDTNFDSDGLVLTTTGTSSTAYAVAQDSSGKPLAAGSATIIGKNHFLVNRYLTSGSLDTTFSSDGKATVSFTTQSDVGRALVLDSNGKLLVAGSCRTTTDFCIARLLTDGALDTTFSGDGLYVHTVGTAADNVYAMAVQSNGRIVVAGDAVSGTQRFAAARYLTNGTLDTTFNTTGFVMTSAGTSSSSARALVIQPDGKIVLAGTGTNSNADFVLLRYTTAGALDTTFGIAGIRTTDIATSANLISAMALQTDNKIVVAGYTTPSTQDVVVARYTTNGTLDTSFNSTGYAISTLAGTNDEFLALAIQDDRKIVAAGIRNNDFYTARFWAGLETVPNDSYSPLFTAISVTPAAAYSLRKLSWDYSGSAVRVRRASDNSEQDIGFNTLNNLDTISLASFCAATSCYVRTWYDQSGNARNATQTTNSKQPRIVNSGTIDTRNSVPTLIFSGAQVLESALTVSQLVTSGTEMTATFVVQQTSLTNSSIFSNSTGTDRINAHASWGDGTTYFDVGQCCTNSRISVAVSWSSALGTATYRRSGAQMDMWKDGTSIATRSNASGTVTATGIIYLGAQDASTNYFTGAFSEIVLFSSGLSTADRQALESNERVYYGTP